MKYFSTEISDSDGIVCSPFHPRDCLCLAGGRPDEVSSLTVDIIENIINPLPTKGATRLIVESLADCDIEGVPIDNGRVGHVRLSDIRVECANLGTTENVERVLTIHDADNLTHVSAETARVASVGVTCQRHVGSPRRVRREGSNNSCRPLNIGVQRTCKVTRTRVPSQTIRYHRVGCAEVGGDYILH